MLLVPFFLSFLVGYLKKKKENKNEKNFVLERPSSFFLMVVLVRSINKEGKENSKIAFVCEQRGYCLKRPPACRSAEVIVSKVPPACRSAEVIVSKVPQLVALRRLFSQKSPSSSLCGGLLSGGLLWLLVLSFE